jgi:CBS domain-containing protein
MRARSKSNNYLWAYLRFYPKGENVGLAPKGAQYRVSTPNLEGITDFPYTFKWTKLPGKTVAISRVIATLINPKEAAEAEIAFSVFSSRESFSRVYRSVSDLLRSCDKIDTQSIVKESVSKFYFDINPPIILENKTDRIELILKKKGNLAEENYIMCEGWMYESEEATVKEIMRQAIEVKEGTTVSEVVKLMVENKIGAILVKKHEDVLLGYTVGIVTEQDLLQKVLGKGMDPKKTSVEQIMTTPLITVNVDTTLDDAIDIMVKKDVRRLPIEEKGKVVGMITDRDLIRAIPMYFRGATKKRIFFPY